MEVAQILADKLGLELFDKNRLLEEARKLGFCIANCLSDSYNGKVHTGLFIIGENGYRIEKLISVEELINELMTPTKNSILAKVNSENVVENTVNF